MGKKGPLALVTPAEFKERTALTLSSRSGTTVSVDKAYENYHATRSPIAAKMLYDRLSEYVLAHGGSWARCERNVVSGGLMEYIYNTLKPVALSPEAAAAMDQRAQDRIRNIEIPHARFGVLHFLANIKVELDGVQMFAETAGAVGGVVGVGMMTDLSQTGDARNGLQTVAQTHMGGLNARDLARGGTAGIKGMAAMSQKLLGGPKAPPGPSVSSLPTTQAALDGAKAGLSELWDANRYTGALAYAGSALASPVVLSGTLLIDLAKTLWSKIKAAVQKVCEMISSAWSSRYDLKTAQRLGKWLKKGAVVLVDYIMQHAIPFLGGAVELGTGLARTISEVGTRLASWNDRRHIRLQAGHPEALANAIEAQMGQGIGGGVLDMLRGAARVSVGVFLPGLGALVSVVMSGIEWLVKLVLRLSEASAIEEFLHRARQLYDTEKRRARQVDGALEPNTSPGGIITDTAAFTEFFHFGCKASPLIPMLTLNSGLGGSLMTLLQLFEADGSMSRRATANVLSGETREFDRGNAYFTRLKRYGVIYMRNCGFKFTPLRPDDKSMAGYLAHATGMGKERQSHVEAGTTLGRAGAMLTG
jgi:hypothetical protein